MSLIAHPCPLLLALALALFSLPFHQVCFFVRGSSCAATEVDYYLLPAELESAYLHATPAADSATTVTAATATTTAAAATATTIATTTTTPVGVATTATATTTSDSITTASTTATSVADNNSSPDPSPSPDPPAIIPKKPLRVRVRPPWLETYSEQVVLLDWPLLVPQVGGSTLPCPYPVLILPYPSSLPYPAQPYPTLILPYHTLPPNLNQVSVTTLP